VKHTVPNTRRADINVLLAAIIAAADEPREGDEMGYVTTGKNLGDMAAEVRQVNIEKGWRSPDGTPLMTFGEYVALLHSELSEALEAFRDHGTDDATEVVYGNRIPKPEGVGSEFADVLIRLLDACDAFGIDLEREYRRKVEYNRTRAFRHGGRAL
jgi:NTP pyrophosphatase (non-canonical NTP hydrolase)